MPFLRAQAQLQRVSNLGPDVIVNTFHCVSPSGDQATHAANFAENVNGLYTNLASTFSSALSASANAHRIKIYEIDSAVAGAADDDLLGPLHERTFTMSGMYASGFPAEVALCISMNADLTGFDEEAGTTRPKARRRGRIFLGPLADNIDAMDATTKEVRLVPAVLDAILGHFGTYHAAMLADSLQPAVYSRQNNTAPTIRRYSADDAFDVVRSRGVKPTVRRTLAVAGS